MKKTKTKGILSRKDLVGIARIAQLSESTVIKWFDKTLAVKPETEFKIFQAADLFYQQETLKLRDSILKIEAIESRLSETKATLQKALKTVASNF